MRRIWSVLALTMALLLGGLTAAHADPSGPGGLPPGSPVLTSCPMLQVGSQGDCVHALQSALGMLGYTISADGDFGPVTQSAVIQFQANEGLEPDGKAGPATLAALEHKINNPTLYPAPEEPKGTLGGVFRCEYLGVVCNFYFNRYTTLRLQQMLDEHSLTIGLVEIGFCAAFTGHAGLACSVLLLVGKEVLQHAVNTAVEKNGCLRIRWAESPTPPHIVPLAVTHSTSKYCHD